jgi:hypothetical protein
MPQEGVLGIIENDSVAYTQSKEKVSIVAGAILKLLDLWGVSASQGASLLDMPIPVNDKAVLDDHIKTSQYTAENALLLLKTFKMLGLLFPGNKEIRDGWFTMPNKYFDGDTPLDHSLDKRGGLKDVLAYLEAQAYR